MHELTRFLTSRHINSWIAAGGYDTYFRKSSFRTLPENTTGDLDKCLELANIQAHDDVIGKQGFARFLGEVIRSAQEHGYVAIYVENVLNKRFEKYLVEKQGFKHMPRGKGLWGFNEVDVCLYKRI